MPDNINRKMFNLENKIAVITGGFGQLGQQFACALCDFGAKVAVFDILDNPKKTTEEFLSYLNDGKIISFKTDITNRNDLESALQKLSGRWDVPDILINNAAIDSPPDAPAEENGPFENYPDFLLDKILDVNVKGTFLCCQVIGGAMAKNGKGSIINISSVYGNVSPNQDIYEYKRKSGIKWYKPAAYSISKSAVLNLTRYLATYWSKSGVRVNTLSPAGIFNNQDKEFLDEYIKRVPMGRMAESHELNGTIVFLASEASSYVTGANILVDGGYTAW